ncbi:MAG: hypothetical protein PHN42_00210 [Bacilli bacterium]|nr:hypothetical protein [Bacilli bacterium]
MKNIEIKYELISKINKRNKIISYIKEFTCIEFMTALMVMTFFIPILKNHLLLKLFVSSIAPVTIIVASKVTVKILNFKCEQLKNKVKKIDNIILNNELIKEKNEKKKYEKEDRDVNKLNELIKLRESILSNSDDIILENKIK